MVDFTAGMLERIAASAYDLVAHSFLDEPSAAGLQGQKLEPICTEPYCGGLFWTEGAGWHPPEAPPMPAMPHKGGGKHTTEAPDEAPPKPKDPHQAYSDMLAARPLDKLDLTGAKVFLPLDKPIATHVKLKPANQDEWQWWMAENSVKLTLGLGANGNKSTIGELHRDKLTDHLSPFLRVDDDVEIGGKKIPAGSQLLTVKPHKKPLRVSPWIGGLEDLKKDKFPIELTFGGPKRPDKDYSKIKGKAGGPPDERQPEEPMTLPVKRLDVVLRKPREGLKDFLPPLMIAREAEPEPVEE